MDELEQWITEQMTKRYAEAVQAEVDRMVAGGGSQLTGLINTPAVTFGGWPSVVRPWTCRAGTWGPW